MNDPEIVVDGRHVEWTNKYGDREHGYVEMVLAIPDEYPPEVVAAVVEAQRK